MSTIVDRHGRSHQITDGCLVEVSRHRHRQIGRVVNDLHDNMVPVKSTAYPCGQWYSLSNLIWLDDNEEYLDNHIDPNSIVRHRRDLSRNFSKLLCTSYKPVLSPVNKLIYRLRQPCSLKNDYWFWQGVTANPGNPREISYANDPRHIDITARRRKCSVKKFLSGPAKRNGLNISEYEILVISNLVGQLFPTTERFSFEVVSGVPEVLKAYYEPANRSWSCMTRRPYVRWYGENPDSVSVVKIMSDGTYCGRALLWTTTDGDKFLDTVYPNNGGSHYVAVLDYAKDMGWKRTRELSGLVRVVKMNASSTGRYPYCDTFKYCDNNIPSSGEFYLRNRALDVRPICSLDNTTGGYSRY